MTSTSGGCYHLTGILLPQGVPTELWVADGRLTRTPMPGAVTVARDGWILPGLVDAHCHIGLDAHGGVDRVVAEAQARADLMTGVTLVRDAGAPIDTHWLDDHPASPRIIRAGRHVARLGRYIRGFAVEVEPGDLVEEVRRQGDAGDGWVKLVGDWIDRRVGDLTPLWPVEHARSAILAAHEMGVRVTAHCFGEESVRELVRCGIDCIEHGCGLDQETCRIMAGEGIGLVPTLDNLRIFPGIADQAEAKYPVYAAHMRRLYANRVDTIHIAMSEGVPIYAGTDAGGTRHHGTLVDEVEALAKVGGAEFALGAASWGAREWLDAPGVVEGAPADLIVVRSNPLKDVSALRDLGLVMRKGVIHEVGE